MIWPVPPPLFNPVSAVTPLTFPEILAGPFGLFVFLLFVPLIRFMARSDRARAIVVCGAIWVFATAGPWSVLVLAGGVALGAGWIWQVGGWRERGRLGRRGATAAVWIGLTAMIFPLWWFPNWSWFGWAALVGGAELRPAALHNLGFAYFYLRLIAWGVDMARAGERGPLRLIETAAWLAYPACMRLGPVMGRDVFFQRLQSWSPRGPIAWGEVLRRVGLMVIGGAAIAVLSHNMPRAAGDSPDIFSTPQHYSTDQLLRVVYYGPLLIYFLLWTYNELAAVVGQLVGIPVDNNFHWLPLATSVADFWRRWHVTVGLWLRNYLYIPLGGNRVNPLFTYPLVFLFCGVWHGSAVSFVVWGAAQAAALLVQTAWSRARPTRAEAAGKKRPLLAFLCWYLTLNYQIVTIFIFLDFEYFGSRILPELARRLMGGWSA